MIDDDKRRNDNKSTIKTKAYNGNNNTYAHSIEFESAVFHREHLY